MRRLEFKYLDFLFEGMREIKSKYFPNSKVWGKKGGEILLELRNSGYLWVSYSIWEDVSNMFSLEYDETQQLIKDWVEQHLELEVIAPEPVR